MKQLTVKKEGRNTGRLFWNCQQIGDACNSFLWDDEIDSKPNAWKIANLVSVGTVGNIRPDQRTAPTSYKLLFELIKPNSFEAKIVPPLQDKDVAAFMTRFSSSNTVSSWIIPLERYHELLSEIPEQCRQLNHKPCFLPQPVLDRYLAATSPIPSAEAFNRRRIPDSLWSRLLGFQRAGIEQVVSKFNGRSIIADEMGLGKTVQAIGLMSYYSEDRPILIVVPSSLRFHWKESIRNWLPSIDDDRIHIINTGRDWPKDMMTTEVVIVSYALLSKFSSKIRDWAPKFVILDESHFIKNPDAQRSGAAVPMIRGARRSLLLSGTPTMARPSELFTQADSIHEGIFGTYKAYGIRYCDGHEGQYGWVCRGATNLRELHTILNDAVMIRRLKKDVMKDLPPKFRSGVTVSTLSSTAAKDFKRRMSALDDVKDNPNLQHGAMSELYHDTGLVKVADTATLLVTKLESSLAGKFLVFAHHQDVIEGIEKALQKDVKKAGATMGRIDGSTSQQARVDIVNRFQSDPGCRVLILSIKAASVGLTLTAASNVIFAELSWTPQDLLQAEDRVHRIGQADQCVNISYLLAKGTLDDIMWPMIHRKLSVCSAAVDGGQGAKIQVGFKPLPESPSPRKRQRTDPKPVLGPMDRFVQRSPVSKGKPVRLDDIDMVDLTQ